MSLKKQLISGGVGTLAIRVLGTGIAFILSVFLARTLGADGFGLYSFVLSLIIFLSIPLQAGFPNLVVRETAKSLINKDWPSIKGLISWVIKLTAIYSVILSSLAVFIYIFFPDTLEEDRFLILIIGFVLIALIPLLLIQGAFIRGIGRVLFGIVPDVIIRPGLALIIAGLIFYSLYDNLTPLTAMVAYVISVFIAAIFSFILIWIFTPKHHRNLDLNKIELNKWKQAAYPLTVVGGLQLMYSYIDIIILGLFHENEDVGIYRAVGQLGMLVVFGLSAINQMLHSHFAKLYAENQMKKLQKIVKYSSFAIFAIAAVPSVVFLFAGEFLLEFVFGTEYIAGALPLIILTLGQLANATFGSVGALLNMTGHEKDAMRGMIYSLGINLILSFMLIPNYGMVGAATATAISLLAWNMILRFFVKKRLNIETIGFIQVYKERVRK